MEEFANISTSGSSSPHGELRLGDQAKRYRHPPPSRLSSGGGAPPARTQGQEGGGGGGDDRDAGPACLDKRGKSVAVEGMLEVTRFTQALEGPRRCAGPCEPGGD